MVVSLEARDDVRGPGGPVGGVEIASASEIVPLEASSREAGKVCSNSEILQPLRYSALSSSAMLSRSEIPAMLPMLCLVLYLLDVDCVYKGLLGTGKDKREPGTAAVRHLADMQSCMIIIYSTLGVKIRRNPKPTVRIFAAFVTATEDSDIVACATGKLGRDSIGHGNCCELNITN